MEYYQTYMARQEVSPDFHARLLALEAPKQKKKGGVYMKFGALAACAALIFGLGSGWWHPAAPAVTSPVTVSDGREPENILAVEPTLAPDDSTADSRGFVAQGPGEEAGKLAFPMILGIDFGDATKEPQVAASIAFPPGSFSVDLEKEDILKLFWGKDGKPAVENPKLDTGDLPLMLMNWAGYDISARATYDGNGELWELAVWGDKGEDSFALRAAPGRIPPTCLVERGSAETQVNGVPVTAWYRSYDCDGDGVVEQVCTSQFMAGDVGIRFENVGSGGMRAGGDEATDLDGAIRFNSMLVTQMLHADGGLYLDEVAHCDGIPAWAQEKLESLAQALEYEAFAPYLPKQAPEGYAQFTGNKDFGGYYSYQEGGHNYLFVRWSRNYDDVEVVVHLPEGDSTDYYHDQLVDVSVPESYDWRLYSGSISDSVPEEYRANFYKPAFRAGDMSLEVVKARGRAKDTGGMAYRFYVIHDNGVVVDYECSGVSAEYVWSLVEATLG